MQDRTEQAQSGIVGLDDVLSGGLERGRVFLLEGSPGTGKITIALQFLRTGAAPSRPRRPRRPVPLGASLRTLHGATYSRAG
jgi:replicative DNA helicase